mgnify:CR=1 FL=1
MNGANVERVSHSGTQVQSLPAKKQGKVLPFLACICLGLVGNTGCVSHQNVKVKQTLVKKTKVEKHLPKRQVLIKKHKVKSILVTPTQRGQVGQSTHALRPPLKENARARKSLLVAAPMLGLEKYFRPLLKDSKKKKAKPKKAKGAKATQKAPTEAPVKKALPKKIPKSKKKLAKKKKGPPPILLPKSRRFKWALRRYYHRSWSYVHYTLRRRGLYEKNLRKWLKEKGAPEDLFLLAGVESGYHERLISPAWAAGMWQFIPRTGRHYGLKINTWVDERRNVQKATYAAAAYLTHLYKRYGKWEYAIGAYNAGEWSMNRALKRCPGMSFWKMRYRSRCKLPNETKEYVASFFALLYYYRNFPKKKKPVKVLPAITLTAVETPGPVSLANVATAIGLPLKDLFRFNPELSHWATPPGQKYKLLVPPLYVPLLKQYLSKPTARFPIKTVLVKAGASFRRVARKYRISKRTLKILNRLWGSKVPKSRTTLIIPILPEGRKRWYRSTKRALSRFVWQVRRFRWKFPAMKRIGPRTRYMRCYKVKRGDTLKKVLKTFRLQRSQLYRYNAWLGASLKKGWWLRLRWNSRCPKNAFQRKRSAILAKKRKKSKKRRYSRQAD